MAKDPMIDEEPARTRAEQLENIARATKVFDRGFNSEVQQFFSNIPLEKILRKDSKVLELGCGSGETARYFAYRYGVEAHGVDVVDRTHIRSINSIAPLAELKRMFYRGFGKEVLNFRRADIEQLPFDEGVFDFAFSFYAFPYVWDKLAGLKEAHRVLKVGGIAVIDLGLVKMFGDWKYNPAKSCVPDFGIINDQYPNHGQLVREHITVDFNLSGSSDIVQRVIIKKSTDEPLRFPQLIETRVPGGDSHETECHYDIK